MNDLYLKRNKLINDSSHLRTMKFDEDLTKKQIEDLINKENNIYNKYKFYDNYIKCINKMGGRTALRKVGEKLEC